MYHAIVKRIAKKNFERINQKDFEALANDCAPNVHHRFGGKHALGGERHDREALRRWLGRLGRLGPGLKLTVHDVWVKGLPHNTTVIVRWSATDTLPDGSPYNNHDVHIVRMRWEKIVEIDANEDSQAVAESLKVRAAYGLEEALAPQIVTRGGGFPHRASQFAAKFVLILKRLCDWEFSEGHFFSDRVQQKRSK